MGEERAGEPGQHGAEGERLQLHAVDRHADRLGGDLRLAYGIDRAAPATGQQVVGEQLDDERQAGAHPEIEHLAGQHRAFIAQWPELSQRAHGGPEPLGAGDVADAGGAIRHGRPRLGDHERHHGERDRHHRQVVAART